jgi:poly(A) polymerase
VKPAGQLAPQPWMTRQETRDVMAALSTMNTAPRFVGGCVRDAMLDRAVKDIDIATPDAPEVVIEKLATAGLKSVPTGLKHGTITAVANGQPFEVTTLRRDVETDGRHAKVAFTDDWTEDAARRDLTVNAIYCDLDGTLYDPVDGLADLRSGTVRFVGDADDRIQEDVLRILRFFRFFAHYSSGDMDAPGLKACMDHAHLLPGLSAERISGEVLRLLSALDPVPTVQVMADEGVLAHILPGDLHINDLQQLVDIETGLECPDPLRRLFVLGQPDKPGAKTFAASFRLSNEQKIRVLAMADSMGNLSPDLPDQDLRKTLYIRGVEATLDASFVNQAKGAKDSSGWTDLRQRIDRWRRPQFPLKGQDVLDLGLPPGPQVGELVKAVHVWWVAEDFDPDRDACLAELKGLTSQT